ncbi:NADPH-dependent F420 reductase [Oxalobacteraceae bacterium OTU3CINTB1]|nr:NADPH-dependent F420 reductase [Oxalobacteraceae bacterium OTU3CINTB1]
MNISIIGAGAIGSAIARNLSKAGIAATIANSRGPESLAALQAELPNIRPVTIEQAAKADVVFLAVQWSRIPEAVRNLPAWNGRIVVDANNAIEAPSFKAVDLGGRASSLVIADLLPGARVVKAFNHLGAALLQSDPQSEGGRRVLFYSGDDADAKKTVGQLIDQLGFAGVDLGTLDGGGRLAQFPGGPLPVLNLVKFG